MSKIIFFAAALFLLFQNPLLAQHEKEVPNIQVMTLGVFHFSYRNLDVHKTAKEDQIDVLSKSSQAEIKQIVENLAQFKPTHIAVELEPMQQSYLDSLLNAYKAGKHKPGRDEIEQLGFRLAKKMNLTRLYCTNAWGKHYKDLSFIYNDTLEKTKRLIHYVYNNPDTIYSNPGSYAGKSIREQLITLNDPQHIKKRLGVYLTGLFKYEDKKRDFLGVHFQTGRWFNRNLKIFRNIQRIPVEKNDRILLIYGADHLNLLNIFFNASPEYELVPSLPYLHEKENHQVQMNHTREQFIL